MRSSCIFLAYTFLLFACTSEVKVKQADESGKESLDSARQPVDPAAHPFNGNDFKAEAYKNDSLGWGYAIFIDGKKTINQPRIPGLPGMKGFNTKEQALKTADFIIYKIQHNMLPPSVSPKELDSLGVLE